MDDDTESCNWCEMETGSGFTHGGLSFCDEECAEAYEAEFGEIG